MSELLKAQEMLVMCLKSLRKQYASARWMSHNHNEKERPESEAFSIFIQIRSL